MTKLTIALMLALLSAGPERPEEPYGADEATALLLSFEQTLAADGTWAHAGFANVAGSGRLNYAGEPTVAPGIPALGNALYIPGNRVAWLDGMSLAAGDGYTVECWFKPRAFGSTVLTLARSESQYLSLYLHPEWQNVLAVHKLGDERVVVETGVVVLDRWQHLALVVGADGSMRLYLNGTCRADGKGEKPAGTVAADLSGAGAMTVVVGANAVKRHVFQGWLDQVRVSSTARRFEALPEDVVLEPQLDALEHPAARFARQASAAQLAEWPAAAIVQVNVRSTGSASLVRLNPQRVLGGDFFLPDAALAWSSIQLWAERDGSLIETPFELERRGNRGVDTMDWLQWQDPEGRAGQARTYYVLYEDRSDGATWIDHDETIRLRQAAKGTVWCGSDAPVGITYSDGLRLSAEAPGEAPPAVLLPAMYRPRETAALDRRASIAGETFGVSKDEPLLLAWGVSAKKRSSVTAALVVETAGGSRRLPGRHQQLVSIPKKNAPPYFDNIRQMVEPPSSYREVLAPWGGAMPTEPGKPTYAWSRFDVSGLEAGQYAAALELRIADERVVLPLTLEVWPTKYPADRVAPHTVGVDFNYFPADCEGQYDTGIFPVDRRSLTLALEAFARQRGLETHYYNNWKSPYFIEWRYDSANDRGEINWSAIEPTVQRLKREGKRRFNINNEFSVGGAAIHRIFDTWGIQDQLYAIDSYAAYREWLTAFAAEHYHSFQHESGRRRFAAFFASLADHLRDAGAQDNFHFYVTDEPKPERYALIEQLAHLAEASGIRASVLDNNVHDHFASADWQCFYYLTLVHNKAYEAVDVRSATPPAKGTESYASIVRRLQSQGKKVNWYVTGQFKGVSESRPNAESAFMPLIDCYVIGLMTWAHALDGVFQPHLLYYGKDPWRYDATYGWGWLFPPDRSLVDQGALSDPMIWTTLRFEAIQRGRHDAAYFAALEAAVKQISENDPWRAESQALLTEVREAVTRGYLYPQDRSTYADWRLRAGRLLATRGNR